MMGNERQLNISAPLLSVRKHLYPRATAFGTVGKLREKPPQGGHFSLLVDRSAWESEQVTKPVAVPFIWEKTPGRPKRNCLYDEEPATTPRPPPGRLFEVGPPGTPQGRIPNVRHLSGETCYPSRLLLPGRIFGEKGSPRSHPGRSVDVEHIVGELRIPKLTTGRLTDGRRHKSGRNSYVQNNSKCQGEAFTTTGRISLLERLKENLDEDRESDKGSGDDVFSDALDTLYPSDSLSLDGSDSGLSNSCHQNCGSTGNFAADLQTRAFMMSRFLPEAEAVAVHTPQRVPKKQRMVFGRTVKRDIPLERKPLLKQPGFNARSSSDQYMEYLGFEDEDVEYDDPKIRMGNTCGFFRLLCACVSHSKKKEGMKLKTQPSQPSSGEVNKLTRNCYSGPVEKCAYDVISKKLFTSEVTSQELPKVQNKFRGEPERVSYSSNFYKRMEDRLSSTTCPRHGGISPVRSERSSSLFSKGARFGGLPKPTEPKTDKISPLVKWDKPIIEVPARCCNKKGFEPQVVVPEKPMYAHTPRKKARYKTSGFSKAERHPNSLTKKLETMTGSEPVCNFGSTGMVSTSSCNTEFPSISLIMEKCNQEDKFLGMEELKGSKTWPNDEEESNCTPLLPSLPFPLPRSPSESWLGLTLHSISLRDSFSRFHGGSHLQNVSRIKQASTGPKWEKFLKSSKIHHEYVRYS